MDQGDPRYRPPPPAFFSHKAESLLHEEKGDQVPGQGRPCLPPSPWQPAQEHGLLGHQRGRQGTSGSPRSQVVLGVRGLPLGRTPEDRLRGQRLGTARPVALGPGSPRPG